MFPLLEITFGNSYQNLEKIDRKGQYHYDIMLGLKMHLNEYPNNPIDP